MIGEKAKLRIVIYGAGAIGGVVGGLLALSGTAVVLIGRSGNVNAILDHGLQIITPDGTRVAKLPAFTTPNQIDFGPDDVVFLCVKSQDTENAMRDLQIEVKDIPIFCFQNGVHNEEVVSKYYPRVYAVMVKSIVFFTRDGEVITRGDPPGHIVVGRYPEGVDELVESLAAKLRDTGYSVMTTPDIMPYKWGKLIVNLTNAVGAITNSGGEEASRIAHAVEEEGKEILAQAGIHWIPMKEPPLRRPTRTMQTGKDPFGTPLGSTWQSLTRRQGTVETEFLNGEIVCIAKKLGKRAPINETLLHITEEMAANHELPGKYTPSELSKMLKLE
jgi:2-dehydropantoate 2-reductase